MADDASDNVVRAGFGFFVHAANVFADDAEEEQKNANEKSERNNEGGEALWRLAQKELGVNGIKSIEE